MHSEPVHTFQHCETCGGATDWAGLYGEDMHCTECGNDESYDPFGD